MTGRCKAHACPRRLGGTCLPSQGEGVVTGRAAPNRVGVTGTATPHVGSSDRCSRVCSLEEQYQGGDGKEEPQR